MLPAVVNEGRDANMLIDSKEEEREGTEEREVLSGRHRCEERNGSVWRDRQRCSALGEGDMESAEAATFNTAMIGRETLHEAWVLM